MAVIPILLIKCCSWKRDAWSIANWNERTYLVTRQNYKNLKLITIQLINESKIADSSQNPLNRNREVMNE